MPSLQPELPISRSQHFKCPQSALQGFSLYPLIHCKQKKAKKTPKASNLSLTVLRVHVPNGPDSFCSGGGAPWGTHNIHTHNNHPSPVQGFSLYPLDGLQAKKGNNPPKRGTCPSHFSGCQCPMVAIPFVVAAALPGVHIMPCFQSELPISRAQHFKCPQSAVQGFSLYPLMHCKQKKA